MGHGLSLRIDDFFSWTPDRVGVVAGTDAAPACHRPAPSGSMPSTNRVVFTIRESRYLIAILLRLRGVGTGAMGDRTCARAALLAWHGRRALRRPVLSKIRPTLGAGLRRGRTPAPVTRCCRPQPTIRSTRPPGGRPQIAASNGRPGTGVDAGVAACAMAGNEPCPADAPAPQARRQFLCRCPRTRLRGRPAEY